MIIVLSACVLLIALTSGIHYEILRFMNTALPSLRVPSRPKVLLAAIAAFLAHALEIAVYGAAVFVLVRDLGLGSLSGTGGFSLLNCMYFSAETYTSLGFGDLTPTGPVRLLAGVEALNGLVLIGWSASFTYIAMERFWNTGDARR
jgi:hypothetical protein